jgi:hypothetical protein
MLDNPDVAASIAAANEAEGKGLHSDRAAHATAALAAWTAAVHPKPGPEPKGALAASERLAFVQKDPAWRDRFFAGDVATRQEFDRLNEAIAAAPAHDLAILGVVPPAELDLNAGAVAGGPEMVGAAADLRDAGISTGEMQHFLNDGKYSQAEHTLAQRTQAEAMSDPKFLTAWRAGHPGAKRIMAAVGMVLAAGVDPSL